MTRGGCCLLDPEPPPSEAEKADRSEGRDHVIFLTGDQGACGLGATGLNPIFITAWGLLGGPRKMEAFETFKDDFVDASAIESPEWKEWLLNELVAKLVPQTTRAKEIATIWKMPQGVLELLFTFVVEDVGTAAEKIIHRRPLLTLVNVIIRVVR